MFARLRIGRSFGRSLRWKWILVLVLTVTAGIGLVALIVNITTQREFDRLIVLQAQSRLANAASTFYTRQGSWEGFDEAFRLIDDRLPGGGGNRPNGYSGGRSTEREGPPPGYAQEFPVVIVDTENRAIAGSGGFELDEIVPAARIESSQDIVVDEQIVGRVLFVGGTPALDAREQEYVERTNTALVIGAVGAVIAACVVGVVLSQTFLRPLRELTIAAHAMRDGHLEQRVNVRARDELGELASAFNDMSAQIAHANHLRKQMTADIAHDLRTPLTVITGYLEGMRDGTLKPTPVRFDTMYAEAAQLQRLIEDLRTLSLADAGELRLMRAPVDPADLLDQVKASFDPAAADKAIALTVNIEPTVPQIAIDRERMTQVFANLVGNALRYARSAIMLRAAAAPDGVRLSVADDGTGIAPDVLPYIFERFYRADESRSGRDGAESGLGLAIARSIVEAHGGRIDAASTLGMGTTFSIFIPK